MPWSQKRSLQIAAIKRRERLRKRIPEIQACLDRGLNKRQAAEELHLNPPDVVSFILDERIRPFNDLGYKIITAHTLKCAGGHFNGALDQFPVMFKKRQGWFCILKAYEVRRLKAMAMEAQKATAKVLKLEAEVSALRSILGREGGCP